MKTLLILLFSIISLNLFAQDWDDDRHEKKHNKKHEHYYHNYFTIGLYTGTYMGKKPVYSGNFFFNSISTEIEYFKFSDLSLFIKGTYQFSKTSLYTLTGNYESPNLIFNEPYTNRIVFTFGGRYYLGKKHNKVNPYLQTGITQEGSFVDKYSVTYNGGPGNLFTANYSKFYKLRFSFNLGVGFTVKLNKRLNFDMKYDLMKSLERESRDRRYFDYENDDTGSINAFSVFAGIKYNL